MKTPSEKGSALEWAVKAVEIAILKESPALRENKFQIESRKVITVAGVRHEIDIWVEVDLGKGYKSVFIFECKNWEEKVGKNEIIILSEKIDAVQAQKGFFVAKSYTQDAEAQAAKDARIVLLHVTEREPSPAPINFNFVLREKTHFAIQFCQQGQARRMLHTNINIATAQAYFRGQRIELKKYIDEWASDICNRRLASFPSDKDSEQTYEFKVTDKRTYDRGELRIDGREFVLAKANVTFSVRLVRPPIVSDFEISTRGRVLSLAPVTMDGIKVEAGFIVESNKSGAA